LPTAERLPSALNGGAGKEVARALRRATDDLRRLGEFRELGERALVQAAEHFHAGAVPVARTGWLAGREVSAAQVASVALDRGRGRLDIAALRVDEERLAQVVDGIDVFTRLTRDIIYAFTALHTPESFQHAFPDPAHA
jgi:glutathione S-transferase